MNENLAEVKSLYDVANLVEEERPRLALFVKRMAYERLYRVYF
jgi:hypothetical protein